MIFRLRWLQWKPFNTPSMLCNLCHKCNKKEIPVLQFIMVKITVTIKLLIFKMQVIVNPIPVTIEITCGFTSFDSFMYVVINHIMNYQNSIYNWNTQSIYNQISCTTSLSKFTSYEWCTYQNYFYAFNLLIFKHFIIFYSYDSLIHI